MHFLPILRWTALGISLIFSIVVLGLDAHLTSTTLSPPNGASFEGLGLATACLTLVSLPAMMAISVLRRGAIPTMIMFELAWLFVLWVLWLATAADSIQTIKDSFPFGCSAYIPFFMNICNELTAVEGLALVNWLLLMGYSTTLAIYAVVAMMRGNSKVWMMSVNEIVVSAPMMNENGQQPTTQQMQYPPTGSSQQIPNPNIYLQQSSPAASNLQDLNLNIHHQQQQRPSPPTSTPSYPQV